MQKFTNNDRYLWLRRNIGRLIIETGTDHNSGEVICYKLTSNNQLTTPIPSTFDSVVDKAMETDGYTPGYSNGRGAADQPSDVETYELTVHPLEIAVDLHNIINAEGFGNKDPFSEEVLKDTYNQLCTIFAAYNAVYYQRSGNMFGVYERSIEGVFDELSNSLRKALLHIEDTLRASKDEQ